MELTVLSRATVYRDEEGTHYVKEVFGLFLERLASRFSQVRLIAFAGEQRNEGGNYSRQPLVAGNLKVLLLHDEGERGPGLLGKLRAAWATSRRIRDLLPSEGLVFAYLPSNLAVYAFFHGRMGGCPYFVYSGSEWGEIAVFQWRWGGPWCRRIGVAALSTFNRFMERAIVSGSLFTCATGPGLTKYLGGFAPGRVYEVVPETEVRLADCDRREDSMEGASGPLRLLMVGSVSRLKGIHLLLEAAAELSKAHPVQVNVVGAFTEGGDYYAELCAQAEALGDQVEVCFHGYVTHGEALYGHYRQAHVFVLPTLHEGFPRVIYEAMAHGLPVVTTDVGGIAAVVKHGESGLVVQANQADALRDAIRSLTEDQALRQRLISEGYVLADRVLGRSQEEQVEELLARYSSDYVRWQAQAGSR